LQQIRRELFRKDLTVGRLRQELGLSANDTTTRFRRHTGAPIRRYVEDRRLECARRLALDTRLGFAEIARLVGFRKPRTFREVFKRRLGCRPEDYRETRTPRLPELPRFVAGVAPLPPETRCGRCRADLEAGTRMRVFEACHLVTPQTRPILRESAKSGRNTSKSRCRRRVSLRQYPLPALAPVVRTVKIRRASAGADRSDCANTPCQSWHRAFSL
jgi:AraC-like DNA-binding protein